MPSARHSRAQALPFFQVLCTVRETPGLGKRRHSCGLVWTAATPSCYGRACHRRPSLAPTPATRHGARCWPSLGPALHRRSRAICQGPCESLGCPSLCTRATVSRHWLLFSASSHDSVTVLHATVLKVLQATPVDGAARTALNYECVLCQSHPAPQIVLSLQVSV